MRRLWKWTGFTALFVLLCLVPYMISEYRLNLAISMLIYSLFAVSYNMLFGYAGLLSFGHAAYFGMGGYMTAILFKHLDLPLVLGILGGGTAGGLLGLLFGIFVARMGGVSFALLTLAFNQLIYATAEKWRAVSGGEEGINFTRPDLSFPLLGKIDMFSTVNWYYFVLLVVGICVLACWYFTRTPLGRLNLCMKENEERARFIGYNTYASRVIIYVISTFFAGVAGALMSSFQEFMATTSINLDKAAEVLIMTFIGGRGTFFGPIIGACFLTYINDFLSSLTERWAMVQGAVFILLVLYAPRGLAGIVPDPIKKRFSP
jgi:branched-chain amino acid transport system permease protein